jgi:undecaprenyl-diphosphatase
VSQLVSLLLALPPVLVLLAALLFPAVEASALVGLVVPGETAVFIAGLSAHGGHLPLWAVVAAASVGAVVGDHVGFRVGRRLGPRLLARMPKKLREHDQVDGAIALVGRRGGLAVLAGRWTAVLRALMPGLAGASGMSTRTFAVYNVLGGLSWAATVSVLGYAAGAAYEQVLATMNRAGQVGVAGALLLAVLLVLVRRIARPRRPASGAGPSHSMDPLERGRLTAGPGWVWRRSRHDDNNARRRH